MNKLTKEGGLEIQRKDLEFWEHILKPEYFEKLEARVDQENEKLTKESDGYDVLRGSQISCIVENFRYKINTKDW
jgi:hypothetical protein